MAYPSPEVASVLGNPEQEELALAFKPCDEYEENRERWDLITALLSGTDGMRKAAYRIGSEISPSTIGYLPKEPAEKTGSWARRLARSFLFEMFADALDRLTDRPFAVRLALAPQGVVLPPPLDAIEANADRRGRSLHQFSRDVFFDGCAYGLSHVLVDMPTRPPDSLGEANSANFRPSFVHIKACDLIGAIASDEIDPSEIGETYEDPSLVQIRVKTCVKVRAGRFGTKTHQAVRVIQARTKDTDGYWAIIAENDKGAYYVAATGPYNRDRIPMRTFYTNRKGFLDARPPMMALGWCNLAHFQSDADQRNIMRFARIAMIFMKGLSNKEKDELATKSISWNEFFTVSGDAGDMKYVEHSGQAIQAGERDIERLVRQGEVLGSRPMIERISPSTATGVKTAEGSTLTRLQQWTLDEQQVIADCYKDAAELTGKTLPDKFGVSIFHDFQAQNGDPTRIDSIIKSKTANIIDAKTACRELLRHGLLAEGTDVDQVAIDAKAEIPAAPAFGGFGG